MTKPKKLLVLVLLLLAAGGSLFLPAVRVLSVRGRKNPELRFYSTAACKDGFIISYTHSVNKGRVHDFYRITKSGSLELYKTQFVSYGAGIPEAEETPGATFTVMQDGYIIENLNRVLPRLTMAVGIIANHTFAYGNEFSGQKEYPFTDFFPPQTSIILEYKKISIIEYIKYKI